MGRARKSADEFRIVLSGRVPPDVKRAVLAIAKREGVSASRIVARLIETGLFHERNYTPKLASKM